MLFSETCIFTLFHQFYLIYVNRIILQYIANVIANYNFINT